jgi:hypothetical protein
MASEAVLVTCLECAKNFDCLEKVTLQYTTAKGEPRYVCKDCGRLRKTLQKMKCKGFDNKMERQEFFGAASGLDATAMAQLAKTRESQTTTDASFEEDLARYPHYTEADLRQMQRFQTPQGEEALSKLLSNSDVKKVLPLTGEEVWPLPELVMVMAKRRNTERTSTEELVGEKAVKKPKAPPKAQRDTNQPPKALAKNLRTKGENIVADGENKLLDAVRAIAAAQDPLAAEFVAPATAKNLIACRDNVKTYIGRVGEAMNETPPPSKEDFNKLCEAAKEALKELQGKLDLAGRRFLSIRPGRPQFQMTLPVCRRPLLFVHPDVC